MAVDSRELGACMNLDSRTIDTCMNVDARTIGATSRTLLDDGGTIAQVEGNFLRNKSDH